MKRFILITALTIATFIFILSSCNRQELYHNMYGLTQGTTYSIVYQSKLSTPTDKIDREIEIMLLEIDSSLSNYNKSSLISAINMNQDVITDDMFREVFQLSGKIYGMTDGLFDITVGPLVKAWGFGPDAVRNFDTTRVDSLLEFVGFDKIRLVNDRVIKDDDRIWIDVNAIAQGYSVDLICRLLDEKNIPTYLVEIGGEVRAKGRRGDRPWRVGLDRPVDNNNSPGEDLFAVVELENLSLATSGNYRKFYIDDAGIKYSHTINPITGAPVRNTLLSATITAPDCATADAFATACMVAGLNGAKEMITRFEFLEGYLIYSDETGEYRFWVSEKMKSLIKEE